MRVHVAQEALLPFEFGMFRQVVAGLEIDPTGMTHGRRQRHPRGQRGIGHFGLDGSGDSVRRLPALHAARRQIHMAAKAPLVGIFLFGEAVVVVRQERLSRGDINLPFVLRHELLPPDFSGISTQG